MFGIFGRKKTVATEKPKKIGRFVLEGKSYISVPKATLAVAEKFGAQELRHKWTNESKCVTFVYVSANESEWADIAKEISEMCKEYNVESYDYTWNLKVEEYSILY